MSQTRFDSTEICHIHQEKLDSLERVRVCESSSSQPTIKEDLFLGPLIKYRSLPQPLSTSPGSATASSHYQPLLIYYLCRIFMGMSK